MIHSNVQSQHTLGSDKLGRTICIAVIATYDDGKEGIIIATDHMISVSPIGQFERTLSKYKIINDNTIAMLSGNPLLFDEFLEGTYDINNFDEIKDCIQKNMEKVRKNTIQQQILDIYQIDYNYIQDVLKGSLENSYIKSLIKMVSEFSLETNILLTGFKGSKAQIVEITENRIRDFRDINIGAIGSGTVQALNTLLFQRHSMDDNIATAIYNVYKAKRNAEVSIGVGKETDMLVSIETKHYILKNAHLLAMSRIYEHELKYGKTHKNVFEIVEELLKRE